MVSFKLLCALFGLLLAVIGHAKGAPEGDYAVELTVPEAFFPVDRESNNLNSGTVSWTYGADYTCDEKITFSLYKDNIFLRQLGLTGICENYLDLPIPMEAEFRGNYSLCSNVTLHTEVYNVTTSDEFLIRKPVDWTFDITLQGGPVFYPGDDILLSWTENPTEGDIEIVVLDKSDWTRAAYEVAHDVTSSTFKVPEDWSYGCTHCRFRLRIVGEYDSSTYSYSRRFESAFSKQSIIPFLPFRFPNDYGRPFASSSFGLDKTVVVTSHMGEMVLKIDNSDLSDPFVTASFCMQTGSELTSVTMIEDIVIDAFVGGFATGRAMDTYFEPGSAMNIPQFYGVEMHARHFGSSDRTFVVIADNSNNAIWVADISDYSNPVIVDSWNQTASAVVTSFAMDDQSSTESIIVAGMEGIYNGLVVLKLTDQGSLTRLGDHSTTRDVTEVTEYRFAPGTSASSGFAYIDASGYVYTITVDLGTVTDRGDFYGFWWQESWPPRSTFDSSWGTVFATPGSTRLYQLVRSTYTSEGLEDDFQHAEERSIYNEDYNLVGGIAARDGSLIASSQWQYSSADYSLSFFQYPTEGPHFFDDSLSIGQGDTQKVRFESKMREPSYQMKLLSGSTELATFIAEKSYFDFSLPKDVSYNREQVYTLAVSGSEAYGVPVTVYTCIYFSGVDANVVWNSRDTQILYVYSSSSGCGFAGEYDVQLMSATTGERIPNVHWAPLHEGSNAIAALGPDVSGSVYVEATSPTGWKIRSCVFSVEEPEPVVLSKPTADTIWKAGYGGDIDWTPQSAATDVRLYKAGKCLGLLITSHAPLTIEMASNLVSGSDYQIKATNTEYANDYDISPQFTITGSLKLGSLTNEMINGEAYYITWSHTGVIESVDLELLCGDVSCSPPVVVGSSIPCADKYFVYTVPAEVDYREDYTLQIKEHGADWGVVDTTPSITVHGSIVVTSPIAGGLYAKGETVQIAWTYLGDVGSNVRIYLIEQGGDSHLVTDAASTSMGTYGYMVGEEAYPYAKFQVVSKDHGIISGESGHVHLGPSVIISDVDHKNVVLGKTLVVQCQVHGPIDFVDLQYYSSQIGSYVSVVTAQQVFSSSFSMYVRFPVESRYIDKYSASLKLLATNNSKIYDDYTDFTVTGIVNITAPRYGNDWTFGSTHFIEWTKVGDFDSMRLELWNNPPSGQQTFIAKICAANSVGGACYDVGNVGALQLNWNVPSDVADSSYYQIKANATVQGTGTADDGIYAIAWSDHFAISSAMHITEPYYYQGWKLETSHDIKWSCTDPAVTTVDINAISQFGGNNLTVATAVANTGSYTWTVPASVGSGEYSIVVQSSDKPYIRAEFFRIRIDPRITVTTPASGHVQYEFTPLLIEWDTQGSMPLVSLYMILRMDYGPPYGVLDYEVGTIATNVFNSGTYWYNGTSTSYLMSACDGCEWVVEVRYGSYNDKALSDSFTVERVIEIVEPVTDDIWQIGDSADIKFTVQPGFVDNVRIELHEPSSSPYDPTSTFVEQLEVVGGLNTFHVDKVRVPSTDMMPYYRLRVFSTCDHQFESEQAVVVRSEIHFTAPQTRFCNETSLMDSILNVKWLPATSMLNKQIDLYFYQNSDPVFIATVAAGTTKVEQTYQWTVPRLLTDEGHIEATEFNDSSSQLGYTCFIISDNFAITSPVAYSKHYLGQHTTLEISWTWTTAYPLDIALFHDGVIYEGYVSDYEPGFDNPTYSHDIGVHELKTSHLYQIGIRDSDYGSVMVMSDYFTIIDPITVSTPIGGDVYSDANNTIGVTYSLEDYTADALDCASVFLYNGTQQVAQLGYINAPYFSGEFPVPDNTNSQLGYRVRVTACDFPAQYGTSDSFFIIHDSISIYTPDYRSQWVTGTNQTIKFGNTVTHATQAYTVFSAFLMRCREMVAVLGEDIEVGFMVDGLFTFTVPTVAPGDYSVMVTTGPDETSDVYDITGAFPIVGPQNVSVSVAGVRAGWAVSRTHTVSWSSDYTESPMRLSIETLSGERRVLMESAPPQGSAEITMDPADVGQEFFIRAELHSNAEVLGMSETFTVIELPSIFVTSPDAGLKFAAAELTDITWHSAGSVDDVSIELWSGETLSRVIAAQAPNTGSFGWTVPGDIGYGNVYRVKVVDKEDSEVSDFSGYFTLGEPAPRILYDSAANDTSCEKRHAEVYLLLDGSSSVSTGDYKNMIKDAQLLAKGLMQDNEDPEYENATIAVGAIQFSDSTFGFAATLDLDTVDSSLDTMYQQYGSTDIDGALKAAWTRLQAKSFGDDFRQFVVLFTDGMSTYADPRNTATAMKAQGITIVSVGIGDYDRAELEGIVSTPVYRHLFISSGFEQVQFLISGINVVVTDSPGDTCSSTGDPHFTTFDGTKYDFQGYGEFWLVYPLVSPGLSVQARQLPCSGSSGVSCNRGYALSSGTSHVSFVWDAGSSFLAIKANGLPVDTVLSATYGDITVNVTGTDGGRKKVVATLLGSKVEMVFAQTYSNIYITPSADSFRRMEGLCGTYDGCPNNDFKPRDAGPISPNSGNQAIYDMGMTWQVADVNSLFDLQPGETYTDPSWKPVVDPPTFSDTAKDTCSTLPPVLRDECMYDVTVTDDTTYRDSAQNALLSNCQRFCDFGFFFDPNFVPADCEGLCNFGGEPPIWHGHWYDTIPPTETTGADTNRMQFKPVAGIGGTYTYYLEATDLCGSVPTEYEIEIKCPTSVATMPEALAGDDVTLVYDSWLGYPDIELDGSKSTGDASIQLMYSWKVVKMPPEVRSPVGLLETPRGVTTKFSADVSGTYKVELAVYDGCVTSIDTVTIKLEPNPLCTTSPYLYPPQSVFCGESGDCLDGGLRLANVPTNQGTITQTWAVESFAIKDADKIKDLGSNTYEISKVTRQRTLNGTTVAKYNETDDLKTSGPTVPQGFNYMVSSFDFTNQIDVVTVSDVKQTTDTYLTEETESVCILTLTPDEKNETVDVKFMQMGPGAPWSPGQTSIVDTYDPAEYEGLGGCVGNYTFSVAISSDTGDYANTLVSAPLTVSCGPTPHAFITKSVVSVFDYKDSCAFPPVMLDRSDSYDEWGRGLSYVWAKDFYPAGSQLWNTAGQGLATYTDYAIQATPDVPGDYGVYLYTQNGCNMDSSQIRVQAVCNETLNTDFHMSATSIELVDDISKELELDGGDLPYTEACAQYWWRANFSLPEGIRAKFEDLQLYYCDDYDSIEAKKGSIMSCVRGSWSIDYSVSDMCSAAATAHVNVPVTCSHTISTSVEAEPSVLNYDGTAEQFGDVHFDVSVTGDTGGYSTVIYEIVDADGVTVLEPTTYLYSYRPQLPGTYTLYVTAHDKCDIQTQSVQFTAVCQDGAPSAVVLANASSTPLYAGEGSISLSAMPTNPGRTSHINWYAITPEGSTSYIGDYSSFNTHLYPDIKGQYQFIASIYDRCGVTNITSATVAVTCPYAVPVASATVDRTTVIAGQYVTIDASASTIGGDAENRFSWKFDMKVEEYSAESYGMLLRYRPLLGGETHTVTLVLDDGCNEPVEKTFTLTATCEIPSGYTVTPQYALADKGTSLPPKAFANGKFPRINLFADLTGPSLSPPLTSAYNFSSWYWQIDAAPAGSIFEPISYKGECEVSFTETDNSTYDGVQVITTSEETYSGCTQRKRLVMIDQDHTFTYDYSQQFSTYFYPDLPGSYTTKVLAFGSDSCASMLSASQIITATCPQTISAVTIKQDNTSLFGLSDSLLLQPTAEVTYSGSPAQLFYEWSISGPGIVGIEQYNVRQPSFDASVNETGVYEIYLKVTDYCSSMEVRKSIMIDCASANPRKTTKISKTFTPGSNPLAAMSLLVFSSEYVCKGDYRYVKTKFAGPPGSYPIPTPTPSGTGSPSPTPTPTPTPTATPTPSATPSPSPSRTAKPSGTPMWIYIVGAVVVVLVLLVGIVIGSGYRGQKKSGGSTKFVAVLKGGMPFVQSEGAVAVVSKGKTTTTTNPLQAVV